jgi:hypothetical protein
MAARASARSSAILDDSDYEDDSSNGECEDGLEDTVKFESSKHYSDNNDGSDNEQIF